MRNSNSNIAQGAAAGPEGGLGGRLRESGSGRRGCRAHLAGAGVAMGVHSDQRVPQSALVPLLRRTCHPLCAILCNRMGALAIGNLSTYHLVLTPQAV